MTLLNPSARRWDATPKRRIVTTIHRIAFDAELGSRVAAAQTVQSAVYDATVEHLDRHGHKPWQVPSGGPDSVLKWLTRERRRHPNWQRMPLVVARGAAQQAWMAWSRWDEGQQAHAEQCLEEHAREDRVRAGDAPHPNNVDDPLERAKHQPSPRLVRRWTREPGQCHRRGMRLAALRLAVPCTRTASGGWQIPGAGLVRLHAADEIGEEVDVRSCQVVETTRADTPLDKRRYALHMQSGHEVPESLGHGSVVGLDYGIRHTVTTSTGERLDRPDTAELEERAKALLVRARTRCRRGSRQWTRLLAEAKRLRGCVARQHDRFERDTAVAVVRGSSLVAREDLQLPNMTAAGTGTTSAPGSGAKRGLNRELGRARLGQLDARIVRRCAKTGTDTVCVHPGNTSITCNQCRAKDPKSRRAASFACTGCGHLDDADANAAANVRDRGTHVFTAWKTRQGRRRPSSRREPERTARIGQRAQAVQRTPGPVGRHACLDPQNNPTTRAGQMLGPVKSGI